MALIGENGAGKTTLVKVLCGLYHPSAGDITIDHTPLASLDPNHCFDRVAVVHQDFVQYELLLREAVGIGHMPDVDQPAAVTTALQRAEAVPILEALPGGIETQPSRRGPLVDPGSCPV